MIQGCILYNRMDIFQELISKISEWNKIASLQKIFMPLNRFYLDFMTFKTNDFDSNLNTIIESWKQIQFLPNQEIIKTMSQLLQRFDY